MEQSYAHPNTVRHNESRKQSLPEGAIRLVDCAHRCIVTNGSNCEYLTLSYVWGKVQPSWLVTTNSNVEVLSQPSALDSVSKCSGQKLPRTIADAIELTTKLNFRYLWVDSLCIVQDSVKDKEIQIQNMHNIYQNSVLTIIQANADHADIALPGVITPRPNDESKTKAFTTSSPHCIMSFGIERKGFSKWSGQYSTRGWTYQEEMLSPRRLYLTSDMVEFHCDQGIFKEGYTSVVPLTSLASAMSPQSLSGYELPDSVRVEQFRKFVMDYSLRKFTDPDDFLRAFAGLYNHLCHHSSHRCSVEVAMATPLCLLPRALFWLRNRTYSPIPVRRLWKGAQLPSWSWSTWDSHIWSLEMIEGDLESLVEEFHLGLEKCRVDGGSVARIRQAEYPSMLHTEQPHGGVAVFSPHHDTSVNYYISGTKVRDEILILF
jgi:Heterokaryon incompatibility protein (HET)